mmetsp:Transcript_107116/g.341871  ORF Transcript_107116/g.341871 Transcript_107116/m.341871 type:complete len:210 (+) Transcript_107116:195-824(+)
MRPQPPRPRALCRLVGRRKDVLRHDVATGASAMAVRLEAKQSREVLEAPRRHHFPRERIAIAGAGASRRRLQRSRTMQYFVGVVQLQHQRERESDRSGSRAFQESQGRHDPAACRHLRCLGGATPARTAAARAHCQLQTHDHRHVRRAHCTAASAQGSRDGGVSRIPKEVPAAGTAASGQRSRDGGRQASRDTKDVQTACQPERRGRLG